MPNDKQERNEEAEALRLGLELTGKLMDASFNMSKQLGDEDTLRIELSLIIIQELVQIISLMQDAIPARDAEHALGSETYVASHLRRFSSTDDFSSVASRLERTITWYQEHGND